MPDDDPEPDLLKFVTDEIIVQPEQWMYLSFADKTGFLGAAIVRAHGVTTAALECHRLGINPGGDVVGMTLPEEKVRKMPTWAIDRLLNEAQVRELFDNKVVKGLLRAREDSGQGTRNKV